MAAAAAAAAAAATKLSDEDYENLYEAALLDYANALDAITNHARRNDDDDANDDSAEHRRRCQRSAELHSRLLWAGAERLEVLDLVCARSRAARSSSSSSSSSSSFFFARGLLHQAERQLSRDVAPHSRSLEEAFLSPPTAAATTKATAAASVDDEDLDVDMDAFFRDYPHARKPDDEECEESDNDDDNDNDNEDDGACSGDSMGNDDVQCLGVKRPAKKPAHGPPTLREDASTSTGEPQRPTPLAFQYTPLDPTSSSLPDPPPDTAAVAAAAAMPPPPPPSSLLDDHGIATATATRNPPEDAAARSRATRQPPQASWDDDPQHHRHYHYHGQNPFQTAREYAQVAGGDAAVAAASHGDANPFSASSARPPTTGPAAHVVGYNPYLKPNPPPPDSAAAAAAPERMGPEPPVIRDSLRRKFQPPKLGGTAHATGGVTTQPPPQHPNHPPRGRVPSTGGVLVKQALGAGGGGHRPGSSSGRSNGRATHPEGNGGDGGRGRGGENDDDDLPEELQRYGNDLVDKILGEIMDSGEPVTFAEIAGLEDVKQTVQEVVCWPMKRPDLFTGLRKATNGLLLFGPPGTGKTLIGKAIAHESGATFFSISSSSLTSKWIGEGEKLVRTLFAVAAYREPAVVFIDEIDSLLTQRKADENEASRRIKTEFLVQLDGTGTSGQGRVLVVGATNRPQELDDAARRRFVKRLYIPLPEEVDRECLLRVLLEKNNHDVTVDEVKKLAKDTAGFSGADLKSLCTEAAMGPIRQLGSKALDVDANDVPPIAYKHFRMALRRTKPSVAPADLVQYEAFDTTYGFRNSENDEPLDDDDGTP